MVLPKEKKGSRSKKRDPDLIHLNRDTDPAFDWNVNGNPACASRSSAGLPYIRPSMVTTVSAPTVPQGARVLQKSSSFGSVNSRNLLFLLLKSKPQPKVYKSTLRTF
jgi:hypothetical protein